MSSFFSDRWPYLLLALRGYNKEYSGILREEQRQNLTCSLGRTSLRLALARLPVVLVLVFVIIPRAFGFCSRRVAVVCLRGLAAFLANGRAWAGLTAGAEPLAIRDGVEGRIEAFQVVRVVAL
jgi:hypothetical protein